NHMEGDPEAPRRNYATSGMQRVNPNLCLRQRVPGVRARANLDRRLAVLPPSARPSSVRRRPGSSSPPQEKILKTYILLHFITFYYILLHFITFYYILLHFITFLRAFSGSRLPQCARLKPFPSHQFRSHQNVKAALTTKPWTSQQLDPFCACSPCLTQP